MSTDGVAARQLRRLGLDPSRWAAGPATRFPWHAHPAAKRLACVAGSIVFTLEVGTRALCQGDWLDLPAGTWHAAEVGPRGAVCIEAFAEGAWGDQPAPAPMRTRHRREPPSELGKGTGSPATPPARRS